MRRFASATVLVAIVVGAVIQWGVLSFGALPCNVKHGTVEVCDGEDSGKCWGCIDSVPNCSSFPNIDWNPDAIEYRTCPGGGTKQTAFSTQACKRVTPCSSVTQYETACVLITCVSPPNGTTGNCYECHEDYDSQYDTSYTECIAVDCDEL